MPEKRKVLKRASVRFPPDHFNSDPNRWVTIDYGPQSPVDDIPPSVSFKASETPVIDASQKRQHPWTLDEALRLVRGLQPEAKKFGFHVCLGGSVLNTGSSHKDVDLYFHPLYTKNDQQMNDFVTRLEGLWGKSEPIGEAAKKSDGPRLMSFKEALATYRIQKADPVYPDSGVYRKKLKFLRADGRIDLFIV